MKEILKKITLLFCFSVIIIGGIIVWANTPYGCCFIANTELTSGRVVKAIDILEKGLKKHPQNSKISFYLAKAYLAIGETEQASKIFVSNEALTALKDDKNFQDFLVDLSESNLRIRNEGLAKLLALKYLKYQNEEEISRRVVKNYIRTGQILSENSTEIWERAYNIANALKDSELKESIRALLLSKYFQLAEKLRLEKNYKDALDILNKSKIIGKNAEVVFQEAQIYNELGKANLAESQFEEAIQLDLENNNYKIFYANVLKNTALNTQDKNKKNEYFEKIKLLLSSVGNDKRKTSLLRRIVNLNVRYKITNTTLKITMLGEYFYPSLVFKIKPVSDTLLKKYRIVFFDSNQNQIDEYEAPITNSDIEQLIEVTSRNPINDGISVNAKLFLNDELVSEYTNK